MWGDKCEQCDGYTSKPALWGCKMQHPKPCLSEKIVLAIEADLSCRKGVGWGEVDGDLQQEIRDDLAFVVQRILDAENHDAIAK